MLNVPLPYRAVDRTSRIFFLGPASARPVRTGAFCISFCRVRMIVDGWY